MTQPDREKVTVLGDGGWGTALAMVLHERGVDVTLWGAFPAYTEQLDRTRENTKFLPGVTIPTEIVITSDLRKAAEGDLFLSVIPCKFLCGVMERFKAFYSPGKPIVSATKGIEEGTLFTASGIIKNVLGEAPLAVISGPSHAEEVARRMPTTVVSVSDESGLARRVQDLLNTERFRVYTHDDTIGVELGGALKNVVSIAAGIVDGLGFGDNSKSALLARGIVEMGRLGEAMGAQRSTFFGLSGIGDLVASCFSPHGRNRAVGQKLGQGLTIDEILNAMEMVAEGVFTARSVGILMDKYGVEMPICREVHNVIYEGKDSASAVHDLMTRRLKNEIEW